MVKEDLVGADHERSGLALRQGRKRCVDFALGAGVQASQLHPEPVSGCLRIFRLGLGNNWARLVDEQGDNGGAVGTSSCSSSSRFGTSSAFQTVMPVRLPPGRFRLATRPS